MPPFQWRLLMPRWWPTWLGLLLMRGLIALPMTWTRRLGEGFGSLACQVWTSRRHVVRTNLRLCFPELDAPALEACTRTHFRDLGRGLIEAGLAWWAADARLRTLVRVEGAEHLRAALADGRGIILLTGHFTTLEIGARLLRIATGLEFHAMYRPYNNAVMDFFMHRWRAQRSGLPAVPRDDLRAIVKALRAGRALWYAPDQTLGGRDNVFVPFFGVPTLTLTATSRLAQMGRAQVLPYFPRYEAGTYVVRFEAPLMDFPSGDDLTDTRRINALLEEGIRLAPAQYFWIHRRFKARPPGESAVY